MFWTEVHFGKHKGKTLPQIIFSDPDYFFWAYEKGLFTGYLLEEAEEVYRKATSIRIPQPQTGEKLVVEYAINPPSGSFYDFKIVPKSRSLHKGSTSTFRDNKIDMNIPREMKKYDKMGYKLFLKYLKINIFRNGNYRFTKKNCEDFFANDKNFIL